MLLIRGSQEAFSPADPKTFAEIARETDVLSQELSGSGGLAGAYGVAGQAGAQVIRAADGAPVVTAVPAPRPENAQARSEIQGRGHRDDPDPGSPPYFRHITRRSGRPGSSSASSRRRDRSAAVCASLKSRTNHVACAGVSGRRVSYRRVFESRSPRNAVDYRRAECPVLAGDAARAGHLAE